MIVLPFIVKKIIGVWDFSINSEEIYGYKANCNIRVKMQRKGLLNANFFKYEISVYLEKYTVFNLRKMKIRYMGHNIKILDMFLFFFLVLKADLSFYSL